MPAPELTTRRHALDRVRNTFRRRRGMAVAPELPPGDRDRLAKEIEQLLAQPETTAQRAAATQLVAAYRGLDADGRGHFLELLATRFGTDPDALDRATARMPRHHRERVANRCRARPSARRRPAVRRAAARDHGSSRRCWLPRCAPCRRACAHRSGFDARPARGRAHRAPLHAVRCRPPRPPPDHVGLTRIGARPVDRDGGGPRDPRVGRPASSPRR